MTAYGPSRLSVEETKTVQHLHFLSNQETRLLGTALRSTRPSFCRRWGTLRLAVRPPVLRWGLRSVGSGARLALSPGTIVYMSRMRFSQLTHQCPQRVTLQQDFRLLGRKTYDKFPEIVRS